jgi:hypothetical protein
MNKVTFTARLCAVQEVAGFTTTDMAHWFGVKRTTMSHWLKRGVTPYSAILDQLEKPLLLLEKACTSKKFAKKLPVPLSVGLYERHGYIEKLKAYAVKSFSRLNPATARRSVPVQNQRA